MARKDVAQEFVDWSRGDLMMALHAMAGCISIARARLDDDRAMQGVPSDLQRQLRHDLRMPLSGCGPIGETE